MFAHNGAPSIYVTLTETMRCSIFACEHRTRQVGPKLDARLDALARVGDNHRTGTSSPFRDGVLRAPHVLQGEVRADCARPLFHQG